MQKLFVFITAVIILSSGHSLADKVDVSEMGAPLSAILKKLQKEGYMVVKEVEFKKGVYRVKAISPQGHYTSFSIDPKTGDVIRPKEKAYMKSDFDSMIKAVEIAEAAGYKHIYEVERECDDTYEIKVVDKNGKKFELKANTNTGKVRKEWLEW